MAIVPRRNGYMAALADFALNTCGIVSFSWRFNGINPDNFTAAGNHYGQALLPLIALSRSPAFITFQKSPCNR
jgi:hypothetical protein